MDSNETNEPNVQEEPSKPPSPKEIPKRKEKKPTMQKFYLSLAVLFFITTVIFAVLFVLYFTKYNDGQGKDTVATETRSGSTANCNNTNCATPDATFVFSTAGPPTQNICNTPNCIISAASMLKKMNLMADPCVDFSQYACGRFYNETMFPEGRTRVDSFSVVGDANKVILKDIIEQAISPGEPKYLSNMKRFYMSCTNEAKIEESGLSPYLSDTSFTSDWPTLNLNWNDGSFNLNDVIERYEKVYVTPLFEHGASTDRKDSSKQALYLGDASLGIDQEVLRQPRNNTVIMAYQKYLSDVAVVLGANKSIAERDAEMVVDLQIALSKIMLPAQDKRDFNKLYNPVTLAELRGKYPDIDIPRAIRAAFNTANISLPDSERLICLFPTYLGNLSSVLQGFPNRTIQNLFGFQYAVSRVDSLTRRLREIKLDFDKVYTGDTAESPRWEYCLDASSKIFPLGMGRQYVTRTFSESAKTYMEEMIVNLKAEFKKMIDESTWMGQATKDEAYTKLAAIKQKIGYPDQDFQEADIEKKYEKYTMVEDNYYSNLVLSSKLVNLAAHLSLRTPVDKNEWGMPPQQVNAYYTPILNEMVFPAAVLQPPFFSQTFQDSMNYGGIGMVIGHEITHGFDDQGSQYDADGNLRNWWQPSDRDNLVQRTQCLINQYSNFYVKEINMNVSGINTQGETTADGGGIKESFRAYKGLVQKQGELPTLPGLGFTQDQLFFLAFAQLWCDKATPEMLLIQMTTTPYPQYKYRIIGTLQNSEDFAKAYNCPTGSYMNPQNKCSVW